MLSAQAIPGSRGQAMVCTTSQGSRDCTGQPPDCPNPRFARNICIIIPARSKCLPHELTTNDPLIRKRPVPCFIQCIYGKVYEKRDLACIIKKYNKNALRLICYNFRTVNAINFLFPTLHTAPFLYGRIYFGVLHLLRVSIAMFDTPLGSNPP